MADTDRHVFIIMARAGLGRHLYYLVRYLLAFENDISFIPSARNVYGDEGEHEN